jgi:hypothetical protein
MADLRITRNRARCKTCNTILESVHRHDWVSCPCGNYVDGGLAYIRRGGSLDAFEEMCETTTEPLPPPTKEQQQRRLEWEIRQLEMIDRIFAETRK